MFLNTYDKENPEKEENTEDDAKISNNNNQENFYALMILVTIKLITLIWIKIIFPSQNNNINPNNFLYPNNLSYNNYNYPNGHLTLVNNLNPLIYNLNNNLSISNFNHLNKNNYIHNGKYIKGYYDHLLTGNYLNN